MDKSQNPDRQGGVRDISSQNPDRQGGVREFSKQDVFPLAYFITFNCYGARLPGDKSGTVHRRQNLYGLEKISYNPGWNKHAREIMTHPPYELDADRRIVIIQTIIEVCEYRGWLLYAAHVRSNHIHIVLEANREPERIMNDFKSYASRRLNQAGFDWRGRKRWERHGSTQYLWTMNSVDEVIHYVAHEQGEPMEVYVRE